MNEIKFRAWHKKEKKMYNVLAIAFDEEFIIVKRESDLVAEARIKGQKFCGCCDSGFSDIEYDFKEIELMKYIGLKDKKGKEVYEGDILRDGIGLELPILIDNYHGLRFMFGKDQLNKMNTVSGEVIGNVYENEALLGEKHK